MIRIDEHTNYYLYCIYEHGEFVQSCRKLELKIEDRIKAREIISAYINRYCKVQDNKHPIFSLTPLQSRELIELLQQDSKGIKTNLFGDGPSVF
jgi:hypothetical protein